MFLITNEHLKCIFVILYPQLPTRLGLYISVLRLFGNDNSVLRTFYAFILLSFECCETVWCSGFDIHLRLLDCAQGNVRFLIPDLSVDLESRREIACLSLLYMILNNIDHPLYWKFQQFAMPTCTTQQTSRKNEKTFVLSRHNTTQFWRCFINSITKLYQIKLF